MQDPKQSACFCGFLRDQQHPAAAIISSTRVGTSAGPSACYNGFACTPDERYPCQNVELLSYTSLDDLNDNTRANDVWGWTSSTDTSDDDDVEIAIIGVYSGTVFVNVTEPTNPIVLGKLPTRTSGSFWRDIKTYDNYALIVSEASGHGLQVYDLSQLLNGSNKVGSGNTLQETAHYGAFGNAHNLFVHEETSVAYVVGSNTCSGGLHMVDVGTYVSFCQYRVLCTQSIDQSIHQRSRPSKSIVFGLLFT